MTDGNQSQTTQNIHQLGECAVDEEGKFESEVLRFINVVPMNFVVNVFLSMLRCSTFDQNKPEYCSLLSFISC
jgi:hypothetical protein